MKTKILEAIAEIGPLVESLIAAGTSIYSVHIDNHDAPRIHVQEPNGIEIGRQVTHDFNRAGEYDGHSVYVGSINVFWLTKKVEAAA